MSEQSKFKVGDKVVVYTLSEPKKGYVYDVTPCILSIHIQNDRRQGIYAHPKQCRRLIKKLREVVWITEERGEWLMYSDAQYQALPDEQKVGVTPYYKGKAPK